MHGSYIKGINCYYYLAFILHPAFNGIMITGSGCAIYNTHIYSSVTETSFTQNDVGDIQYYLTAHKTHPILTTTYHPTHAV